MYVSHIIYYPFYIVILFFAYIEQFYFHPYFITFQYQTILSLVYIFFIHLFFVNTFLRAILSSDHILLFLFFYTFMILYFVDVLSFYSLSLNIS